MGTGPDKRTGPIHVIYTEAVSATEETAFRFIGRMAERVPMACHTDANG